MLRARSVQDSLGCCQWRELPNVKLLSFLRNGNHPPLSHPLRCSIPLVRYCCLSIQRLFSHFFFSTAPETTSTISNDCHRRLLLHIPLESVWPGIEITIPRNLLRRRPPSCDPVSDASHLFWLVIFLCFFSTPTHTLWLASSTVHYEYDALRVDGYTVW